MVDIVIAQDRDDLNGLSEVLHEYLSWDINLLNEISGLDIRVETYLNNTFSEIEDYFPPRGRLLLARDQTRLVGIGFLKPLDERVCEIKRMYVLPDQRGSGLGRKLLSQLIDEAREIGYEKVLLDSAVYMKAAHALYRSMGFTYVEYYPEGETDEALKEYLVYMELPL